MQAANYEVGGGKRKTRRFKWGWQNSCGPARVGPGLILVVYVRQVSVVNALDMQVVVSTVPPTLVEEKKDQLIR